MPFWWYLLVFGGGLAAVLGLAGLVGHFWHGKGGGWALVWIALGLGPTLAVAAYLANEWIPAVVRLKGDWVERQCFRNLSVYLETWQWSEVAYCRFEETADRGKHFDVVTIYAPSGQCVPLGVPASVRLEELQQWFELRKVPFQQHADVKLTALTDLLADPLAPTGTQGADLAG